MGLSSKASQTMKSSDKIKAIEKVLGVKVDGVWDAKDDTEFQNLINPKSDKKGKDVPMQQGTPTPDQIASAMPTTYSG